VLPDVPARAVVCDPNLTPNPWRQAYHAARIQEKNCSVLRRADIFM
jgi:hypothetical protein